MVNSPAAEQQFCSHQGSTRTLPGSSSDPSPFNSLLKLYLSYCCKVVEILITKVFKTSSLRLFYPHLPLCSSMVILRVCFTCFQDLASNSEPGYYWNRLLLQYVKIIFKIPNPNSKKEPLKKNISTFPRLKKFRWKGKSRNWKKKKILDLSRQR